MLRNVDWTLLGQIEFGRAELRHSNCATLRTCILRFASVVHIGLGQNNRPCVHSGSLIWRSHVCCAIYERLFIPHCGIFNVKLKFKDFLYYRLLILKQLKIFFWIEIKKIMAHYKFIYSAIITIHWIIMVFTIQLWPQGTLFTNP